MSLRGRILIGGALAVLFPGALLAQSKVAPTFQGAAGSTSISAGTQQATTSAPQLAASLIVSGVQAIQGGFLSLLQGLGAVTPIVPSAPIVQTLNPSGGPATLTVPAGAVPAGGVLNFQVAAAVPANTGSLTGVPGTAVQIDCGAGCQPTLAVTIQLSYANANITGMTANNFGCARFDTGSQTWVALLSTVDQFNQVVNCSVRHFSIFQIMASTPKTDLANVRIIPNPFRPNQGHVAMGFFNLPSQGRVRIYTYSGALVKDLYADGKGLAIWDGTNQVGEKAASGTYNALVQGGGKTKSFVVAISR